MQKLTWYPINTNKTPEELIFNILQKIFLKAIHFSYRQSRLDWVEVATKNAMNNIKQSRILLLNCGESQRESYRSNRFTLAQIGEGTRRWKIHRCTRIKMHFAPWLGDPWSSRSSWSSPERSRRVQNFGSGFPKELRAVRSRGFRNLCQVCENSCSLSPRWGYVQNFFLCSLARDAFYLKMTNAK